MTILEECAAEVTEHNQRGIAWALRAAYFQADRDTDIDRNPSFNTPLRPNIRGSIRWNHVMALLAEACHAGRIVGFEPIWRPTGGNSPTNQVLELRGAKCSITAAHINDLKRSPRDAAFRREARDANQMLLEGFEETPPDIELPEGHVHLVLVHGAYNFDFAEIRCDHTDQDGKNESTVLIPNIERWKDGDEGGALDISDQEPIMPAPVELRPAAARSGTSGK